MYLFIISASFIWYQERPNWIHLARYMVLKVKRGPARTMRRSMSCSDLRKGTPNLHQPALLRQENGQGINLTVTKKVTKRPLVHTSTKVAPIKRTKPENQQVDKSAPSKPPPPKARNPPSYDYKARFNILQEKHTKLRDAHFTMKNEHEKMADENEHLLQTSQVIQKEVESLRIYESKFRDLESAHTALKITNSDLSSKLDNLTENHVELVKKYDILLEKFTEIDKQSSTLRTQNEDISTQLVHYKERLQTSEEIRKALHNTMQDMKGNIRVFCRVRPPLQSEQSKASCNINYIDECTLELIKQRENIKSEFSFNKIFPPQATQSEVFEDLSQLVQSALDGYNVCVFAYGQTGSGKTYTMLGNEQDSNSDPFKLGPSNALARSAGMIPRCIHLLFDEIKKLKELGWDHTVEVSFLEIYNETLKDLLDQANKNLDIRYNDGKGVTVSNLVIEPITSFDDFKNYMLTAQKNRAVAATNYNEHSSRSHAVTKIYITGTNKEFNIEYFSSVNLIDLAGSESARTSSGERLTETKNINKSLSALGTVMLALQNKENHVPYRNSKLTYLLQSCLGGNCKTLMVVNISPFEDCFNETTSSLRFAATLKEIKLKSMKNKVYLSQETL